MDIRKTTKIISLLVIVAFSIIAVTDKLIIYSAFAVPVAGTDMGAAITSKQTSDGLQKVLQGVNLIVQGRTSAGLDLISKGEQIIRANIADQNSNGSDITSKHSAAAVS